MQCWGERSYFLVFFTGEKPRWYLRQMLWSRRKGHRSEASPVCSRPYSCKWSAYYHSMWKCVFPGECLQPFLPRMTEMNDTLFPMCLVSTANLCVSCGQSCSSAELTPSELEAAELYLQRGWHSHPPPHLAQPGPLTPVTRPPPEATQDSPSQGLTATAAVLPATHPERKDT